MAIKLYLHIGHPKCGSSTLQQALYQNRQELLKAGVGVADGKLELMKASSKLAFPLGLFRQLMTPTAEQDEAAFDVAGATAVLTEKFQALAARAAALQLDAVVLSAENLVRLAAIRLLAAAKPFFDCQVIYYIRRHDDWLVSSWLQWQFKTGIPLEDFIDQTLKTRTNLFRPVIETCIQTFSADQLRVKVLYPKALVDGNLLSDFWTAIGVPASRMEPVQAQNVSFSPDLVGVLKESPYLFNGSHDNALTSFLDDYHRFPTSARKKDPLGKPRRKQILQHFQTELVWLTKTFFTEEELKGWLNVYGPEDGKPEPETVTLAGIAEMLNLNTVLLKELREDVDKIKKALGIR